MPGSPKGPHTVRLHRGPLLATRPGVGPGAALEGLAGGGPGATLFGGTTGLHTRALGSPPARTIELRARSVIAERYELWKPLGEGGMGAVWSAHDLSSNKLVALKVLKGPAAPDLVKRFSREAWAASAVRHPNVIAVHDIVTLEDGMPAMVMDLLRGETLASRLERRGPMPVSELASIMVPVLSAVGAAHAAGIVHRDLKPANIFLAKQSDGSEQPMVLDFGVCKLAPLEELARKVSTLTVTGSLMGTPLYMSPEQVFAAKDVDARADVWALGVILYEGLTGQRPFEATSSGQLIKLISTAAFTPVTHLAPHVPPVFAQLIERMLAKERGDRPADLREPFATLSGFTSVQAPAFAAATSHASQARREVGVERDAPRSASRVIGFAKRALPAIAVAGACTVAGLYLLGARRSPDAKARPPASASTQVVTRVVAPASAAAPAPPAPRTDSTARPASSAASRPAPRTSSNGPAHAEPSAKPKSETLAGGVHGSVPF